MAILSKRRKKSSLLFRGKFGETRRVDSVMGGGRISGSGFAEKAAKPAAPAGAALHIRS
jgi:hypothetical protein